MKVCEVVLVALLVCQFPSTSLEQSELSTDDLHRVFDLSHIPRTSKDKFAVPRYVMSLYNTKVRMARFWRENSEVIRTFFREGTSESTGSNHHFAFNVSSIQPDERTKRAELRIFKRKQNVFEEPRGSFLVSVSQLTRPWNKKTAVRVSKNDEPSSKLMQNSKRGEWITFDVTSSVKHWINRPAKNFGFQVSIRGVGVSSSSFEMGHKGRREPFLVTFTRKRKQETQRDGDDREVFDTLAVDKSPGNQTGRVLSKRRMARSLQSHTCRRRSLRVSFKDINWKSWIIAPRGYIANYCDGRCPMVLDQHYRPSNHAILQNILHHRVNRKIPCASCVPTKLHSISVLFYNDDKTISLREFDNMVVSTCGCL